MFRNVDEAAGYLAAMIDGEGSVWFRARGVRGASRAIEIANTEPSIISATGAACDMLGITYRVVAYEKEKTSSWKQVYRLLITGRWNYERSGRRADPLRPKAQRTRSVPRRLCREAAATDTGRTEALVLGRPRIGPVDRLPNRPSRDHCDRLDATGRHSSSKQERGRDLGL
jgi:hypothetical protein